MNTQPKDTHGETLESLLASLKQEPEYSDSFESEFLREFHLRLANERQSRSFLQNIRARFENCLEDFRGWQWVYASMALVTLAAIGFIIADAGNKHGAYDPYANAPAIGQDAESIAITDQIVPVSQEKVVPVQQQDRFRNSRVEYVEDDAETEQPADTESQQKTLPDVSTNQEPAQTAHYEE